MKTVVITGHQGAVGAAVASALAEQGYEVVGIDRQASKLACDITLDFATWGPRLASG